MPWNRSLCCTPLTRPKWCDLAANAGAKTRSPCKNSGSPLDLGLPQTGTAAVSALVAWHCIDPRSGRSGTVLFASRDDGEAADGRIPPRSVLRNSMQLFWVRCRLAITAGNVPDVVAGSILRGALECRRPRRGAVFAQALPWPWFWNLPRLPRGLLIAGRTGASFFFS